MKLSVKVKPGSRQEKIETGADSITTIWLKAPPVDGKANAGLIKLLAKTYGVSKSKVRICTGASARIKHVEFED